MRPQLFLPDYIERAASKDGETKDLRKQRESVQDRGLLSIFGGSDAEVTPGCRCSIYDCKNGTSLPGTFVGDDAAECYSSDDAALGSVHSLTNLFFVFIRDVLGVDTDSVNLKSNIHFLRAYNNAFFDGEQMVYGDGDRISFKNFSKDPTVISHEIGHWLLSMLMKKVLEYYGEAGALNESTADVLAISYLHWLNNTSLSSSTWKIGEVCMVRLLGKKYALRDMQFPGNAYKGHPIIGDDPQMGHVDSMYVGEMDNGGVHLNSGIPNRAFYLICEKLNSLSWKTPLQIWKDTLGVTSSTSTFKEFAENMLRCSEKYEAVSAVRAAWESVGVL